MSIVLSETLKTVHVLSRRGPNVILNFASNKD